MQEMFLQCKIASPESEAELFEYFLKSKNDYFDPFASLEKKFPDLKQDLNNLEKEEREKILLDYTRKWHKENKEILEKARDDFLLAWRALETSFYGELSKLFNLKMPDWEMTAYVSIAPIYPRDLHSRRFNINFGDTNFAIAIAMHEILHFFYFEKWKKIFPEHAEDKFDAPHPQWLLSEILAPVILNNYPPINELCKCKLKTYPEFERIKVSDKSVNDYFTEFYKESLSEGESMELFLRKAWSRVQGMPELVRVFN